jgi:ATP-dependent exoDNAse (exonuclease V) beta subunit
MTRARDYLAMFIQEPARNETSFRLWIKQALALEAVEEQHWPAGLAEGTDYTVRYLDEPALSDWEGAVSALSGTFLSCADVHDLSEEIGFDLLQPLSALEDRTDSANVSWTSLARATASGVNDEPHATILGNLFHAVMQRLVVRSHRPTEDEIRRLIASDEIAVADVGVQCILLQECLRLLNIYHESGLCERIATARRFLPEVSYAVFDRDGGCIHRRPDLIFQDEADEWQIVDFKTDKMTVADIAAKVNEHSAQVLDYVDDFRRLTNLSAQGWLYFAELGLLEPVKEPGYVVSGSG